MSCAGSGLGPPLCIISSDYHSNLISHVRKPRLRIFTELVVEGEGHTESKWDSNSGSEAKSNSLSPQPFLPQHHTFVETVLRNQSNSFSIQNYKYPETGRWDEKTDILSQDLGANSCKAPKSILISESKKTANADKQKEREKERKSRGQNIKGYADLTLGCHGCANTLKPSKICWMLTASEAQAKCGLPCLTLTAALPARDQH